MNAKLLGVVVAMSAAGIVVGCGDSGSGGSGGATSSASGSGSTTTSSTKSSSGTGTSTASGTATSSGTGMSCQDTCISMHQAGYALLSQIVVQKCGCDTGAKAVCNTDCAADAACNDNMMNMGLPASGSACEMCIQTEAAKGTASMCVPDAAFDNACSSDADCSAFVSCALTC